MMKRFKFLKISLMCIFLFVFALGIAGASEGTEEEMEFVMWLFNYDAQMMPDYEGYVAEFQKTHPNVDIILETTGFAEYFEMLQTRMHAGDSPDMMITRVGWFPALEKFLEDWNKYLPKNFGDRFYEGPWKGCNLRGKQLGIPTAISTRGLVYRPDVLEELGLKPPRTWDDFYNMLKAIKKGRPDISPWGLQGGNGDLDLAMAQFYHFMASNDYGN
jgi:ABC-type glycerol-3-phosphate transport system substrate-binding protein